MALKIISVCDSTALAPLNAHLARAGFHVAAVSGYLGALEWVWLSRVTAIIVGPTLPFVDVCLLLKEAHEQNITVFLLYQGERPKVNLGINAIDLGAGAARVAEIIRAKVRR